MSSPLPSFYAASKASSSDALVAGLPSPPVLPLQSPSRNTAVLPGAGLRPQQVGAGQASAGSMPRPGGNNNKTHSFISLPGNAGKKRPRRRYGEIERLYQCRCAPILRSVRLSCTGAIHSICGGLGGEGSSALEYELSVIAARMQAGLRSLDLRLLLCALPSCPQGKASISCY